jgi:hypothetical protein
MLSSCYAFGFGAWLPSLHFMDLLHLAFVSMYQIYVNMLSGIAICGVMTLVLYCWTPTVSFAVGWLNKNPFVIYG